MALGSHPPMPPPAPVPALTMANFAFNTIGKGSALQLRLSGPESIQHQSSYEEDDEDIYVPRHEESQGSSRDFPMQDTFASNPGVSDSRSLFTRLGIEDPSPPAANPPAADGTVADPTATVVSTSSATTGISPVNQLLSPGRLLRLSAQKVTLALPSTSKQLVPASVPAPVSTGQGPGEVSDIRSLFSSLAAFEVHIPDGLTQVVHALTIETNTVSVSAHTAFESAQEALRCAQTSLEAAQTSLASAGSLEAKCKEVTEALERLSKENVLKKQAWDKTLNETLQKGEEWAQAKNREVADLRETEQLLREKGDKLADAARHFKDLVRLRIAGGSNDGGASGLVTSPALFTTPPSQSGQPTTPVSMLASSSHSSTNLAARGRTAHPPTSIVGSANAQIPRSNSAQQDGNPRQKLKIRTSTSSDRHDNRTMSISPISLADAALPRVSNTPKPGKQASVSGNVMLGPVPKPGSATNTSQACQQSHRIPTPRPSPNTSSNEILKNLASEPISQMETRPQPLNKPQAKKMRKAPQLSITSDSAQLTASHHDPDVGNFPLHYPPTMLGVPVTQESGGQRSTAECPKGKIKTEPPDASMPPEYAKVKPEPQASPVVPQVQKAPTRAQTPPAVVANPQPTAPIAPPPLSAPPASRRSIPESPLSDERPPIPTQQRGQVAQQNAARGPRETPCNEASQCWSPPQLYVEAPYPRRHNDHWLPGPDPSSPRHEFGHRSCRGSRPPPPDIPRKRTLDEFGSAATDRDPQRARYESDLTHYAPSSGHHGTDMTNLPPLAPLRSQRYHHASDDEHVRGWDDASRDHAGRLSLASRIEPENAPRAPLSFFERLADAPAPVTLVEEPMQRSRHSPGSDQGDKATLQNRLSNPTRGRGRGGRGGRGGGRGGSHGDLRSRMR